MTLGQNSLATRAAVTLTDARGEVKTAFVNQFGYYRFDDISAGQTIVVRVAAKGYSFAPQVVTVNEHIEDLNFSPERANSFGGKQERNLMRREIIE